MMAPDADPLQTDAAGPARLRACCLAAGWITAAAWFGWLYGQIHFLCHSRPGAAGRRHRSILRRGIRWPSFTGLARPP